MPNILNGRFLQRLISYFNQVVYSQQRSPEKHRVYFWDTPQNGSIVALVSHLLYLIARVNLKSPKDLKDHIFNQRPTKFDTLDYIALLIINILRALSILNTIYTFSRNNHHHFLENPSHKIRVSLSTQNVKNNSFRGSPSWIKNVFSLFRKLMAETRTDQGSLQGTYKIVVWDPSLLCLKLFCLFSPGHVLIYWLFYPDNSPDTHPGLDIIKVIFLQFILSLQLCLLETHYTQRAKDLLIIHGNVMNEYNIKFIYPRLNRIVRDSGTQYDYIDTSNNLSFNEPSVASMSQYLDYDDISTLTGQHYEATISSKSCSSEKGAVPQFQIQSPLKNDVVRRDMTSVSNDLGYPPSSVLSPLMHNDHPLNLSDSYREARRNNFSRRKFERGPSFF